MPPNGAQTRGSPLMGQTNKIRDSGKSALDVGTRMCHCGLIVALLRVPVSMHGFRPTVSRELPD
jgi:hypothetical protein